MDVENWRGTLENWRRTVAEERMAAVAVGVLVVAVAIAVASYARGNPQLAYGLDGGLLAGAGMILAGTILFLDLLEDYASTSDRGGRRSDRSDGHEP